MTSRHRRLIGTFLGVLIVAAATAVWAQKVDIKLTWPDAKWVTVTEMAAGTTPKAKDQAVAAALRKAVEQTCGVFIRAQSKSKNYKAVYDKVIANTPGYVLEYEVVKVHIKDGITFAKVNALVSKKKFSQDWVRIAHTVHQEGNPRVIIVIGETAYEAINTLAEETERSDIETAVIAVESHRRAGGVTQVDATRVGAAGVVGGRFNWWGRPRPRWYVSSANWGRLTAEQRVTAYEDYAATLKATVAKKSSETRKIWKNIATKLEEKGAVQTRIEEFFLEKGINLVDRTQAGKVNKRDLMLASAKDDLGELAAIGARLKADVVILGTAAAKPGNEIKVGSVKMYQYATKLMVRAIRTDSGKLMVAKVFTATKTSTLRSGGEAKALDKLAAEAAPKLLEAIVEAWRKQVNVTRNIEMAISGMDYAAWKLFQAEVQELRGTQAVRRREITNNVATISVEYDYSTENLADELIKLKSVKLKITEITATRMKLEVVKK